MTHFRVGFFVTHFRNGFGSHNLIYKGKIWEKWLREKNNIIEVSYQHVTLQSQKHFIGISTFTIKMLFINVHMCNINIVVKRVDIYIITVVHKTTCCRTISLTIK